MIPEHAWPIMVLAACAVAALTGCGARAPEPGASARGPVAPVPDVSGFSDAPPARPPDLLFIHHSCGGHLLAAFGPENGTNCIYVSHPNGGGLRARLEQAGYRVHEASYGSRIGQDTDVFDWPAKFRDHMEAILTCASQDQSHADGRRNRIVIFKSCFPNNAFVGEGRAPGEAAGPELTVWNARAAYAALLSEFRRRPDVLFVCVTAPPLAPKARPLPAWRRLLGQERGRAEARARGAAFARRFNDWLKGEWLAGYDGVNVVVFDYYDVLTGGGLSNLSAYPTGNGSDSHPSRAGNEAAAAAFAPFLNRAMRRAGVGE